MNEAKGFSTSAFVSFAFLLLSRFTQQLFLLKGNLGAAVVAGKTKVSHGVSRHVLLADKQKD